MKFLQWIVIHVVDVFSYEGKYLRSWGEQQQLWKIQRSWGIAIYKNIIFIVDTSNRRIQAFTCTGKFIFEYKCKKFLDMANIIIVHDYIFVNDWTSDYIIRFKLTY